MYSESETVALIEAALAAASSTALVMAFDTASDTSCSDSR